MASNCKERINKQLNEANDLQVSKRVMEILSSFGVYGFESIVMEIFL